VKIITISIGLLIHFFVLGTTSVFPEIYKCVSDNGTVKFSDEPCGKNSVVAFKTYVPSVDGAIASDVLERCYDKTIVECVSKDLNSHAKRIADSILPRERFCSMYENHSSRNRELFDKKIQWIISLYYGPEINKQQWIVEINYQVVFEKNVSIHLNSISVDKDGEPFEPPTMNNLKKLKHVKRGKWVAFTD